MRRPLLAVLLGALLLPASAQARPRWETKVLALVPTPGFPARAYVHPNGRIYEGTYDNPSGDKVPSRVFEYTGDGALLHSWTVPGQDLSTAHGIQVATSDALGRLVLLDKAPARALLLDPRTGAFDTYATFPDLPACPAAGECSPAGRDQTPMADYGAWGPDGSLYVTDYQQAVVWRVPPGGGTAHVWLADPRLDGDMFGTAGIALAADHRTLLVAQASSAGGADGDPTTGKLYSVPIGSDGKPGPMKRLWGSGSTNAPDGLAIARSGKVYVALVGPTNQIAVVNPDGSEAARFPKTPFSGENGTSVPFDSVSSVMFLGTRLIVAQQSYEQGNFSHMAILDVEAGEDGIPELIPPNAGLRPGEHVAAVVKPKAKKKARRVCKRHGKRRKCRVRKRH